MTTTVTTPVKAIPRPQSGNPDAFNWVTPYGGFWNVASNWQDITAGASAVIAPDAGSTVNITGGANGNFTDILGTGAAAQLSIASQVLLWGTLNVGGTLTLAASANLDLDGAILTAANLNLNSGALLGISNASTLAVSAGATLAAASILVTNGSTVQLGSLIANSVNSLYPLQTNLLAVDDNAVLEIGSTGGATAGAVTFDQGVSAAMVGTIDGNIVLKGNLGVQAYGHLTIDVADPYGSPQSITGTGTLTLSQNSLLTLGVADSAAIRFGGPNGTLELSSLPTATISGFAAGDVIKIASRSTALATGLSYAQPTLNSATLILTKGGRQVGTITLAGNYTGSQFHLSLDTFGNGVITVRTVGSAPMQPGLILGTVGFDTLNATAANQILTGFGGADILSATTFTGVAFRDTTANLNGVTVTSFNASDTIDLTDLKTATATVTYTQGANTQGAGSTSTLIVTDGTQTATINLAFAGGVSAGYFTTSTDGAGGTNLRYIAANIDAYAFNATPGGSYATASKWLDTTTGSTPTVAPGYGNAVTIAGGATAYTGITGSGFAASLLTSGNVLLLGSSLVVGGRLSGVSGALAQTGTLALDGASRLTLTGSASIGGVQEVEAGSTLTVAGALGFATNAAQLLVTAGSSAQFAAILGASLSPADTQYNAAIIGVDATSSIEIGTSGSTNIGALTIDNGVTANLAGTIQGNLVVNGTLSVAGALTIIPFASTTQATTGAGTIQLTWGDTLTLGGSDSAAILFDHTPTGAFAVHTETLALLTPLFTGMISGFAAGDVITLAKTVTSLSYVQSGTTGRLTLMNSTVTVGTFLFSGTYVASQFLLQLSPNGSSCTITYAVTPDTAAGTQVSGGSQAYIWNNASGGAWTNSRNWIDTVTGATPVAAPGGGNAVTIGAAPDAWTAQIITGNGSAASLTVAPGANTVFTGNIAVAGQFYINTAGFTPGSVALSNGANFTVGSLNVSAPFAVAAHSLLTVTGSSATTSISSAMAVIGGSSVRATGGTNVISGAIAVDATSSFEFGAAGATAAGSLTIDSGQTLILQGAATIAAKLVVNGNLTVYGGTIQGFGGTQGAVTGIGTITIGALGPSGSLVLNATNSAAIAFKTYTVNNIPSAFETLELAGPLPTGPISGFIAGDAIIVDRTVTGATYKQNGAQGTLTLTNGASTLGILTLVGTYTASLFQVDVAPATGVATISLQAATASTVSGTASTGSDAYSWSGASGGSWATATNWKDTTSLNAPARIPGSANAVTIAGTTNLNQYTTIGGTGSAARLTTSGNVVLTGQANIAGSVLVTAAFGPPATLALAVGAKLTATGSLQVSGKLQVQGTGSAVTVTGNATVTSGSMLAFSGAAIQAAGLIGTGGSDIIAVDTTSIIKIGAPTTAAVGALTQAANAPIAMTGAIYGSVVANGTISVAAGGSLFIDMNGTLASDPYASAPTISGTGTLSISEGSTLGLGVIDSAAILFAGPNGTLALAAVPTATITGFVAGDQIQLNMPVTGMVYRQTTTTTATLTLTNGGTQLGTLKLAGTYGNGITAFHLDVPANSNTAVITLQSLTIAASQPTLIQGTLADDLLTATANGQTITGFGGGDNMTGSTFTGIIFKDITANLNGDVIQNFAVSDSIDLTDLRATGVSYNGSALSVTDGSHSATINLGFATMPTTGAFHIASDGATGSLLTWS